MKDIMKEMEKHDRYVAEWTGNILGKLDRIKKEQKHYMLAIMFLQIITLIVIVSTML